MKRAWLIAVTELRLFLRSKTSYVWLFAVPLAFTYFLGFANRGPGTPSNPRPAVLIENGDAGFLSEALLRELDAQGMRLLSPTNRDQAERGIRIPTNFTARVLTKQQSKIEFFRAANSGEESAALIEARLLRAIITLNSHLVEAASRGEAPLTAASLGFIQDLPNPVSLKASFAGRRPVPAGFNQSLPGILVMSLLMNLLIFGGASLAEERRNGVLRRLLANPTRPFEVVTGKIGGSMLLGFVQAGVFLLLGQFAFRVNIGPNLFATLLTLTVYVWMAASLGVFLGSVILHEDKIVALCVLTSLVMAALGGCWWPLEIVPESLQVAAHFLPTAWAMDALHQLISFGSGLTEIARPLAVLGLFGLGASVAAMRFFRV